MEILIIFATLLFVIVTWESGFSDSPCCGSPNSSSNDRCELRSTGNKIGGYGGFRGCKIYRCANCSNEYVFKDGHWFDL